MSGCAEKKEEKRSEEKHHTGTDVALRHNTVAIYTNNAAQGGAARWGKNIPPESRKVERRWRDSRQTSRS